MPISPNRFFLLLAMMITPAGMISAQQWILKLSGSGLGDPLVSNPLNSDILYGCPYNTGVFISRDRGYTWRPYGSFVALSGSIKSIAVNSADTSQMLCGVEGGAFDRIYKSTNGGISWTAVWGGTFSYFGKPVEFKPQHPDTVYTMGSDTLWRSTDFGSTWSVVAVAPGFTAWCDAEIRPDSANIMFVGDYASGIWKTRDYGATWRLVYATNGAAEIPSIAIDPLNPRVAYASKYSGGGGFLKSTDGGENWQCLPTPIKPTCSAPSGGNSWWVTCSPVSRGYVYFGTYGSVPGGIFLSRDSGASWTVYNAGLSTGSVYNYGLLVEDTLTVIALQADGIYKLQYPTGIRVLSPRGGEEWLSGSPQAISWADSGLYAVKLEYTTDGGSSWHTIADSIPASQTSYPWTVPAAQSNICRVRVSDALFTQTSAASDTTFTIYALPLSVSAPSGGEAWDVGTLQTIRWFSVRSIPRLDLSFSPDSGATWQFVVNLPSQPGAFSWDIPDAPSERCKLRIADAADSTRFALSAGTFRISASKTFAGTISVSDGGSGRDQLVFGTQGGATDGIDTSLGEHALGPVPAPGTFDARWCLPDSAGTGSRIDIRDTLSGPGAAHSFFARLQPGPGGYPIGLRWSPDSLKTETFIMRDTLTRGGKISVDMRRDSTALLGDSTVGTVEILECNSITIPIGPEGGWNLISLPLLVGDRRAGILFPHVGSAVFAYDGGYLIDDTLAYGAGYWIRTNGSSVTGCPLSVDTIALRGGWNMIGPGSTPLATSSLVQIPDTLVASNFFSYTAGGYSIAATLEPGSGYWVKARVPGFLFAGGARTSAPSASGRTPSTEGMHTLTIGDGEGHSQTLYFAARKIDDFSERMQMPPAPPEGDFDARFGDGSMGVVDAQNGTKIREYPISLHSLSPEIFFSWDVDNEENMSYILVRSIGRDVAAEYSLRRTGSLTVPNVSQSTFALKVQGQPSSAARPIQYSLGEVYPNPCNPTARCDYEVPTDAHVRIEIFNILGQRITTLLDAQRPAGHYVVEWRGTRDDGETVAGGIYLLRMRADASGGSGMTGPRAFSSIRKFLSIR